MRHNATRYYRTVIRYCLYALCVLPFLLVLAICGAIFINPFSGFDGQTELDGVSGDAAKLALGDWPSSVDPATVATVSYKCDYSRDSFSSWYRIALTDSAAKKWIDEIHHRQIETSKDCLHHLHEKMEGVQRTIAGPPPQNWQTGTSPKWWKPPRSTYRATEVMLWYSGYDSGVGRATYSVFDAKQGTLWVYDYASQHDLLWDRGMPPDGKHITATPNRG